MAVATVFIDKDHLDLDDGLNRTGKEYTWDVDEATGMTRKFELYDDDDELYYTLTIHNCNDEVAEYVFSWLMGDSGITVMKDITGDGENWTMC